MFTDRSRHSEPVISCLECKPCRDGNRPLCEKGIAFIGYNRPGGLAPYTNVPQANIHVVPDHVGRECPIRRFSRCQNNRLTLSSSPAELSRCRRPGRASVSRMARGQSERNQEGRDGACDWCRAYRSPRNSVSTVLYAIRRSTHPSPSPRQRAQSSWRILRGRL